MCCAVSFQQLPLQVQPGPVCIPCPRSVFYSRAQHLAARNEEL